MTRKGDVLNNRYRVVSLLGKGGMGAVWLVEDLTLPGRKWALKETIFSEVPQSNRQQLAVTFKREMDILITLDHPVIPKVIDFFEDGDNHYLVMEYIPGQTLENLVEENPGGLTENETVLIGLKLCEALEYLHSQKPEPIIYRDLKPSNIIITPNGEVKIVDFGISRHYCPDKDTDTFKMGSIGYAPPEQYCSKGQTDVRSDIFSLGATLHHALTGRNPQESSPFFFPDAAEFKKDVSRQFADFINRCIEYKKEDRYNNVSEASKELQKVADVLKEQPISRELKGFLKIRRDEKEKFVFFVILAFILVIAGISGYFRWQEKRYERWRMEVVEKHRTRIDYYMSRGMTDKALAEAREIVRIYPKDAVSHIEVARLYVRKERFTLAIRHYEKALEINPELYHARMEYAIVLVKHKQAKKGIKEMKKAITDAPDEDRSSLTNEFENFRKNEEEPGSPEDENGSESP